MSEQEIEQIELSIEEAQKAVRRGELAKKLYDIPEFNELIVEGYLKNEVLRLAFLASDPNLPENYRDCVNRDIHGPAALKRYLSTLVQMADIAAREIEDHEENLEEIREHDGHVSVHGALSEED